MRNISTINFYHVAQELTLNEYGMISLSGHSTLVVGKGKSKRYFVSLFVRENHTAGIEGDAKSKGLKGEYIIIHHLGKNKPKILNTITV